MLADDLPPPKDLDLCLSLATDDIMLFAKARCPRARAAIRQIDDEVHALGIQSHRGKDINESSDCTLIGIDLRGGRRLVPARDKTSARCQNMSKSKKFRFVYRNSDLSDVIHF